MHCRILLPSGHFQFFPTPNEMRPSDTRDVLRLNRNLLSKLEFSTFVHCGKEAHSYQGRTRRVRDLLTLVPPCFFPTF